MATPGGDILLCHWPQSRAALTRWLLEELGVPYQIKTVDITASDHPSKELLALNPMGKLPVLKHRDMVIFEVSAICCYPADRFPTPVRACHHPTCEILSP